jgi:hypothetical protein
MKADGPSHIGSRTKVIIASLVVVLAIASAVLILDANDSDTSDKYSISIDLGDGIESVTGGGEFKEGTEITLEAELEEGKAFFGWYDSSNNLVSSDNPYVVKVVSDQEYTARSISIYKISIDAGDGIGSVTGGGEFKEGTEITLEAELEEGKAFLGWYDSSNNLVSSDNPYVVKVVSDQRYAAKATAQCTLEIEMKKGIDSVSGAGQYHHGQQVTVTADLEEGYSFLGWFSDEGLLSKNTTYTFEIGDNISIYAYGESQTMVTETSTGVFEFTSPVDLDSSLLWTVTSNDTKGVVGTYRSDEQVLDPDGGSYTVRLTGKVCGESYSHSETFIDYGQVSKKFSWTYDGVGYSFVWTLNYSTYLSWRNNTSIDRWPSTDDERTSYVTDSISSIRSISDYLESCSLSMTELERADFVLKFVESTEYVSDSTSRNKAEWFKYPIETLFDNGGDCEDTSILYCALMHSLGYDVALLYFPSSLGYEAGHMAAAVALFNCSGRYYLVDGEEYYYCETTSNWDVGVPWEEYTTAYVLVIE